MIACNSDQSEAHAAVATQRNHSTAQHSIAAGERERERERERACGRHLREVFGLPRLKVGHSARSGEDQHYRLFRAL